MLSGRGAPLTLLKPTFLVSIIQETKHPYQGWVAAWAGIEY